MTWAYQLGNAILDEVLSAVNYTAGATVYIALFTGNPGTGGSAATEPSGNGYARVAVTNNVTNWPAAASGAKSNGTTFTFPQASGSWGTIAYAGICASSTPATNDVIISGALAVSKAIVSGDTPSFASSTGITVTLS